MSASVAIVLLGTLLPASLAAEHPSLNRGFHYLYNLQFADAQAQFNGRQQRFPDDPVGPAAESAAYLFQEFDRLGILELQLESGFQQW